VFSSLLELQRFFSHAFVPGVYLPAGLPAFGGQAGTPGYAYFAPMALACRIPVYREEVVRQSCF